MSKVANPEAEPTGDPKIPEKGHGKEKLASKEKVAGNDGGQISITPEMRQKIIKDYLEEQEGGKSETAEDENELHESLWRISRESVRGPIGKVLISGAVLANPVVAGSVWLGDKLARNTIGRVPVLGEAYNAPRALILRTCERTRALIAAALTSPAIGLDVAENIYEGVIGKTQKEEKGAVGRTVEWAGEKIGGGFNLLSRGINKIFSGISKMPGTKILETGGKIVAAPFRGAAAFTTGIAKALTPRMGGPISTAIGLTTTAVLGYVLYHVGTGVLIPAMGPGAELAWMKFAHWISSFFH